MTLSMTRVSFLEEVDKKPKKNGSRGFLKQEHQSQED